MILFSVLEHVYRRGARRWKKFYRVNGHLFQAKRLNKVIMRKLCNNLYLRKRNKFTVVLLFIFSFAFLACYLCAV